MEDRKAWRRIMQNEEIGLGYLFNQCYESLCKLAEIYLKLRDIASDFFIKLWEQRHQINIDNSVRAFIFKPVKNACLKELFPWYGIDFEVKSAGVMDCRTN